MAGEAAKVVHEFAPLFDKGSKVLVLGTIPSPKSREQGFYYGHPRNRFWISLRGETLLLAVANDLDVLLQKADIRAIFTTGKKAADLYRKYCEPRYGRPCIMLPSTSPANCRMGEDELVARYRVLRDFV